VPKSIAGETTMKMMHEEVWRFAEDMFVTKKCVFREKLRCDALDIQGQNLVHKQELCTIQKRTTGSHVSILKRLYLSDISCGR
jgi:hypothetical protein